MKHYDNLSNRRTIINRREIMGTAEKAIANIPAEGRRMAIVNILKQALTEGRTEIRKRIASSPTNGLEHARATTFLTDQILRITYDMATQYLYRLDNPTSAERVCLVAIGGYGRAEMAPFSDVDLMFLSPMRHTPWVEQIVETILYILWDLGLKVGYSVRTVGDMIRIAKEDLTVQTAILEARYLWGERSLFDEARLRFEREIQAGEERAFIAAKMAERDERHQRLGDSRYVVEPNVKDGKGGLRDLQTLYWIAKFTAHVDDPKELVAKGLLTADEHTQFERALNHLWSVRINLHDLAGRAEERLTFDVQRELAERMQYQERPGISKVERFMRHYFMTAQQVGSLTGLLLTHLEEQANERKWLTMLRPSYRIRGFKVSGGRIGIPNDGFFAEDPNRLLEMFAIADEKELGIHPMALRRATRDASLITEAIRHGAAANQMFLQVLTSPRNPEQLLRTMNEAGVFGRFVPDFGRVVAKMQFDMYHHYTVDEHTIRAIGLLSAIEQGHGAEQYSHVAAIMPQIKSRRALYVAVLLHDIAKGRDGDHSVLGEQVAYQLCPRLGLTEAETDTVAWLVRWHLLMSDTAFKRDLSDMETITSFVHQVASIERLRLLFVLTVVDISAVGPNVYNAWKGQLLSSLFNSAEELLRLGHKQKGRRELVAARQAELQQMTAAEGPEFDAYLQRFQDSYWLAEPADVLAANMALVAESDREARSLGIHLKADEELGSTLVTVYAKDQPGLFSRIAGAIALAGASIVDARIHTTNTGMALDNLLVQDPLGGPFAEPSQLDRLEQAIINTVSGDTDLVEMLHKRPLPRRRQESFRVTPEVFIDNRTSNRFTIVEVTALDRPALLFALTHAFHKAEATIHSAHIATYGERAVDTFYLTTLEGKRMEDERALKNLEEELLTIARSTNPAETTDI